MILNNFGRQINIEMFFFCSSRSTRLHLSLHMVQKKGKQFAKDRIKECHHSLTLIQA
uniref:Uncharacterized protein n=1 Tax=Tetranychus urticae TaxID=32264 RepID=T1JQ59_TETUR